MPMALEHLDLRGYDLVISSESGPSKGIIPPAGAVHLCYCHSPMRYIWNMYHDYRDSAGGFTKTVMPLLAHYLAAQDGVAVSVRTLRRRLHEAGYRWKRPRYAYAGRATHLAQKKGVWSGA